MTFEDFIKILSTPFFWVLSAVGSVILAVIGNLITPKVVSYFRERSKYKKTEARKNAARQLGEVILRFDNPDKLTQTKLDSLHDLLVACVFLLFALVIFTLASALEWILIPFFVRIAIAIAGVPVLLVALIATQNGLYFRRIAKLAEERLNVLAKFKKNVEREKNEEREFLNQWDKKQFGVTSEDIINLLGKDSY